MPLRQRSSDRQFGEQPSPPMLLPSSHCSTQSVFIAVAPPHSTGIEIRLLGRCVSSTPLPHCSFDKQSPRQPSRLALLPSSHCSPAWGTPSPHRSTTQSAEQPSPLSRSPSSHCSRRIASRV